MTVDAENLLILMSDEHSPRVVGCYGNEVVRTPNLDQLAADGTRFSNAYCNSPICVPSRSSFVTGRYPHEIGAWENAAPYAGDSVPSWGHELSGAERHVTTVGKLHFRDSNPATGFADQRIPMHLYQGKGNPVGILRGARPVRDSRAMVTSAGAGISDYVKYDLEVTEVARDWLLHEAQSHSQPWVLYVSFVAPHFPLVVPQRFLDLYPLEVLPLPVNHDPEGWPRHPVDDFQRRMQRFDVPFSEDEVRRATQAYYGLVSFLDENIGRVLDALDASGNRDNTRIIYTSDHGEMLGDHGLWKKSSMYESSVGVPMILAGGTHGGQVCGTNVSLIDCYPTILEAVGVDGSMRDIPGESLWSISSRADIDRTVFSEYHADWSENAIYMVRHGDTKLIWHVGYDPQLFDLAADPHELEDISGSPDGSALAADMEGRLRAIVDPEEMDRKAKADQRRRVAKLGGAEALFGEGDLIHYTPPPDRGDAS